MEVAFLEHLEGLVVAFSFLVDLEGLEVPEDQVVAFLHRVEEVAFRLELEEAFLSLVEEVAYERLEA